MDAAGTAPAADAGSPGTSSDAAARERIAHQFLDQARAFNWELVVEGVNMWPNVINQTPCGRWSALHQAAFATSCAKGLSF